MKLRLRKNGLTSLVITIPAILVRYNDLREGDYLEVDEHKIKFIKDPSIDRF